jgi:glycine dehydrogenase
MLKDIFTKSKSRLLNQKLFKFNFAQSFSQKRQIELEKDTKIDPILKHKNFTSRHIGPCDKEVGQMLTYIRTTSLGSLIKETVPDSILLKPESIKDQQKTLGNPLSEYTALNDLREISKQNKLFKNYIGCGYHPTIVPPVVLRNVLENPAWYTSYTPYQAEISQGRLESLLNYQTMICELTGLPFANASLLDEATAAAEAMYIAYNMSSGKKKDFFVSNNLFPFIKDTIKARAYYLGINVIEGSPFDEAVFSNKNVFGTIVQNPDNNGKVHDYSDFTKRMKANGVVNIVAADIASLMITKSPGEMGFDIAVGSSQRFGVPMMNGGPHAGYLATCDEFKRKTPGRVVGISRDRHGNPALRLAMQTREQHIRRDKATSNICTAQALLANTSAFYAVFHGKEGLVNISKRINIYATFLHSYLDKLGYKLCNKAEEIFDTICLQNEQGLIKLFEDNSINLRSIDDKVISLSFNEQTTLSDLEELVKLFSQFKGKGGNFNIADAKIDTRDLKLKKELRRQNNDFLKQQVFNEYNSETEILRYIYHLQLKDISLCNSLITLGSCTMKMNATSELVSFKFLTILDPSDMARVLRDPSILEERSNERL